MVLHLSNDLMLVGKVSAWAKSNGVTYRNAANQKKFHNALNEDDCQVVLVDLQFKNLDMVDVVQSVKAVGAEIPIYGYAQHVMTQLIQDAEEAGFNEVLTRGQFDRGFARLMS